jgi:hypothetical protein
LRSNPSPSPLRPASVLLKGPCVQGFPDMTAHRLRLTIATG